MVFIKYILYWWLITIGLADNNRTMINKAKYIAIKDINFHKQTKADQIHTEYIVFFLFFG